MYCHSQMRMSEQQSNLDSRQLWMFVPFYVDDRKFRAKCGGKSNFGHSTAAEMKGEGRGSPLEACPANGVNSAGWRMATEVRVPEDIVRIDSRPQQQWREAVRHFGNMGKLLWRALQLERTASRSRRGRHRGEPVAADAFASVDKWSTLACPSRQMGFGTLGGQEVATGDCILWPRFREFVVARTP